MNPDGADARWIVSRSSWLRFERFPAAFGRFARLRRIKRQLRPVNAEQDELDRCLRVIHFATAVALMALLALAGLLLSGARAADLPARHSIPYAGKPSHLEGSSGVRA